MEYFFPGKIGTAGSTLELTDALIAVSLISHYSRICVSAFA